MFRIEAKDISLGQKGLVNSEFDIIFTSKHEQMPNKDGVYYQNIYYGKKGDWQFKEGTLGESLAKCNKCWIYIGDDSSVDSRLKTEGITIEEKMRLFGPPQEK